MATIKQKKAISNIIENHGNISKGMRDAGYTEASAKNPKNLTMSKAWTNLMKKHLSDDTLAKAHGELLGATKIEHLVFPLATEDKDIKELLKSVNCTVKRIQRGEQAVHCWFWARDNFALKSGLDLAYKLKGKYAPEKKEIDFNLDEKDKKKSKQAIKEAVAG